MVCTTGHCIDALRSLTGEDYGTDYRKWQEWWEKTGKALPPSYFHQRAPEATSEPATSATSSAPHG